jgi:hypothetical protein
VHHISSGHVLENNARFAHSIWFQMESRGSRAKD